MLRANQNRLIGVGLTVPEAAHLTNRFAALQPYQTVMALGIWLQIRTRLESWPCG